MFIAMALAPLLVTLDSWDGWKAIAASQGWQWAAVDKGLCEDAGVKELEALVHARQDIDSERVYLAGRGDAAPCVFYAVSRMPHLWAAAVAVEGNPRHDACSVDGCA
jgi:predicted peptidase